MTIDEGNKVFAIRPDLTSPLPCPVATCAGTHMKKTEAKDCYAVSKNRPTEREKKAQKKKAKKAARRESTTSFSSFNR